MRYTEPDYCLTFYPEPIIWRVSAQNRCIWRRQKHFVETICQVSNGISPAYFVGDGQIFQRIIRARSRRNGSSPFLDFTIALYS